MTQLSEKIAPLYNVNVALNFMMVMQADDEKSALELAGENWNSAINDDSETQSVRLSGEVKSKNDLRSGWDEHCTPYGVQWRQYN